MSIELIEQEIHRSLATNEPEVVCISGDWGVGKTFAWRHYLATARDKKQIKFKKYSYVSLFGITSLDELKSAVFENLIDVSLIGLEPNLETLQNNALAISKQYGKKLLPLVQQLTYVKNKLGGISPLLYMAVNHAIICFDDIERRGDKFHIRDVLGLISNLKEQKKCKVVMILNDEKLREEAEEFRNYFEKVVDVSLKFSPTPEQCVRIAIPDASGIDHEIAKYCMSLGIANIRIVKKIQYLMRKIEPLLLGYDKQLVERVAHSLVLFGWCVFDRDNAPSLDFISKFNIYMEDKNKDDSGERNTWKEQLALYRFYEMDEFDRVLLDGVQNGFFDNKQVAEHANKLDQQIKNGHSENEFVEAWELYHGSFNNESEQVLDAIYESFKKNVTVISPLNLNGTVQLLKDLGRPRQAIEAIDYYVSQNANSENIFDLDTWPFGHDVTDHDVRSAFQKQHESYKSQRDPRDILLSIDDRRGWNDRDMEKLIGLADEEFYKLFKNSQGDDLQRLIASALYYDRVGGAPDIMVALVNRTKETLRRIGNESPINARRVRRYGIMVDESIDPKLVD